MFGLAHMCWIAAVYRKTKLTWELAVEFANLVPPEPRVVTQLHPEICTVSVEYYRLIDGINRMRQIAIEQEWPGAASGPGQ